MCIVSEPGLLGLVKRDLHTAEGPAGRVVLRVDSVERMLGRGRRWLV